MFINKNLEFILTELNKHGYSAYLVGGCVRDFVLGKEPHDYDICTNAKPIDIQEIFKKEELLLHGMKHGTITIALNKTTYEITTYRIDEEYSDNRHPKNVIFVDNLEQDLGRRDFTINAMAWNGEIIDPFNGKQDLENKIIRCVGNAEQRFQEDALRILRAMRFASVLDFDIEKNTKQAIFKLYKNLENISTERITAEISKLLVGKGAVSILREFKEIFFFLIPELKQMDGFNQNNKYHIYDVWEHTLHVVENVPEDLILRLTALFHDIGKPYTYSEDECGQGHFYNHPIKSAEITENILKRMKYSNDIKDTVVLLISEHGITFVASKKFARKLLTKLGEINAKKLLIFRKADIIGQKRYEDAIPRFKKIDSLYNLIEEVISEKDCLKISDLAINGHDLLSLGIAQGKKIGYYLRVIFDKVQDDELVNERRVLLDYLKKELLDE